MPASHINDGYKSEKSWRDALMRAVNRESHGKGSRKRLEAIAEKCAKLAMKGESWAIKEIGDRMDGKPAQALQIKGDPDSPVIFNLRLGDGIGPKVINGGKAEDMGRDALAGPLVAIVAPAEDQPSE